MIIRIPVTAFTLEIVLRNLHTWKTVLATFTVTAATSFLCAFPLYITPAQYEERKTIHCLGKKRSLLPSKQFVSCVFGVNDLLAQSFNNEMSTHRKLIHDKWSLLTYRSYFNQEKNLVDHN